MESIYRSTKKGNLKSYICKWLPKNLIIHREEESKKKWKNYIIGILMLTITLSLPMIHTVKADESEVVYEDNGGSKDRNMYTKQYDVFVTVGKDGSYTIREMINVKFLNPRHGIYRNIPLTGTAMDKNKKKMFYIADFDWIANHRKVKVEIDHNVRVRQLKFGSEKKEVDHAIYDYTYKITPQFQNNKYDYVNYNVFPNEWKNRIPKGSSFSIQFPENVDFDQLKFNYGKYGESKNAKNILQLDYDKEKYVVTGTLLKDLPLENGLTCYGYLGDGYFQRTNHINQKYQFIWVLYVINFIIISVLFFTFGRSKALEETREYVTSCDLDSAAAGYIWKGTSSVQSILSLTYYLADLGYLKIEEKGDKEDKKIELIKLRDLPWNAPRYQKILFYGLFEGNRQRVIISSLKNKFYKVLENARCQMEREYDQRMFTKQSKMADLYARICSCLTIFGFNLFYSRYSSSAIWVLFIIAYIVKIFHSYRGETNNYVKTGIQKFMTTIENLFLITMYAVYVYDYALSLQKGMVYDHVLSWFLVLISSVIEIYYAKNILRRTDEGNRWMEQLQRLNNFLNSKNMKKLNETSEEEFYHILPYAMAFGEFEEYAEKLKELAVGVPDWYSNLSTPLPFDDLWDDMIDSTNTSCSDLASTPSSGSGFESSGGGCGGGGGGSW